MNANSDPRPAGQLADRMRLYLPVILIVDLAAHASDLGELLSAGASTAQPPFHVALRWSVTFVLIAGWAYARFTDPRRSGQSRDALRLGQYQLGKKLGEGGMGVVYEATHLMLRRPTAIKLLPRDKTGERTVARFEREVRQTCRLQHPNSVAIYDYGRTEDGQFYYAMEYLDGITLEQLVERHGPISAARAARILSQAAHALGEAHSLGLVHRDIKPANIMLCERGVMPDTVKVLDFGLVKAIDEGDSDATLTRDDAVLGTPHYLSPEAIRSPQHVGPAADVYALGAVGYVLLTGRTVFPDQSLIEVCAHHLDTAPEPPSSVLGSAVDPALDVLILRCLAKRPAERPRDGAALAAALDALELTAWTDADARQWWRDQHSSNARPVSPARTMLAACQ